MTSGHEHLYTVPGDECVSKRCMCPSMDWWPPQTPLNPLTHTFETIMASLTLSYNTEHLLFSSGEGCCPGDDDGRNCFITQGKAGTNEEPN